MSSIRVAGGTPASQGMFPYSAAVIANYDKKISSFCGGSLINRRYVLTAAHCFKENVGNLLNVYVTVGNVDYSQGRKVQASSVIIHPQYNSNTQENDIALVQLSEDVKESDSVQYINLARQMPAVNTKVILSGWGITQNSQTTPSKELQYITLRILENGRCSEYLGWNPNEDVCLGAAREEACRGDSGGSAVYKPNPSDTRYTAVAITSYGDGTCSTNEDNVGAFTRIPRYYDYIIKNSNPSNITVNSGLILQTGTPYPSEPKVCFFPFCFSSISSQISGFTIAIMQFIAILVYLC